MLDSVYLDVDLFDGTGVLRRMTLYGPGEPGYEAGLWSIVSYLANYCNAVHLASWRREVRTMHRHRERYYPAGDYSRSKSGMLSWSPKPEELLQSVVEVGESLGTISEGDLNREREVDEQERVHPPGEKQNFFHPQ